MRIGIDLGGTKIEGIAVDDGGRELTRRRIASPRGSYPATLEAIDGLVRDLAAEAGAGSNTPVGVGIPGAISPATGRIKNANSTWIIGKTLDQDLERRLGRPVRIENDANCFALSEAVDGAGAGAAVVFGVILGTGVGGGLVVDGRPIRGLNAIAGEWGHNPLPWPDADERDGPACYCGKRGCNEVFLSGPGLARDHERAGGKALPAEELAARAEAGETAAAATLERYEDRLARALASVINILDPDAVVLGGGLSRIQRLYRRLPERLPAYVFSDRVETPILQPKHGDSSGVRGAAWLWPAERPSGQR